MKTGKKISGGKYKKQRKRRIRDLAGQRRIVKLGNIKRKVARVKGGNKKTMLLAANTVNISDSNHKIVKATIKNVLETPSNKFLARQNIITKGTIVETDKGRVKITNRPSQEGILNGILIE